MDLRKELVEKCIFPMLKSEAAYEKQYLMGTAIARPLIARALVRAICVLCD
ncbi:MAG: argininosuccinate synthase domain-containing protein [Dethiobacteria bacterium]|jgi:argininosuccinate synthase